MGHYFNGSRLTMTKDANNSVTFIKWCKKKWLFQNFKCNQAILKNDGNVKTRSEKLLEKGSLPCSSFLEIYKTVSHILLKSIKFCPLTV